MTTILGNKLGTELCALLNIDPTIVSRIVIDIRVNDAARVYVETFGSEKLWDGLLQLVKDHDLVVE